MVTTVLFNSIKELYNDMKSNYQSFTFSQHNDIVEMISCYRVVELKHSKLQHGKLHFISTKFGGSEMIITGDIIKAEKVGGENALVEYRLSFEGRNEPLVFLACKKR